MGVAQEHMGGNLFRGPVFPGLAVQFRWCWPGKQVQLAGSTFPALRCLHEGGGHSWLEVCKWQAELLLLALWSENRPSCSLSSPPPSLLPPSPTPHSVGSAAQGNPPPK